MRLFKNLNAGTIYAEAAWITFLENMMHEVEKSPGKTKITETNLVPLGHGSENQYGDIFALIQGPEQGLGRIFTNNIDETTTKLIIKLVQNCHFLNIKVKNRATNLQLRINLLVGHNTPWEAVKSAIECYIKKSPGFTEEGFKTFGFIQNNQIQNFDLVRTVF